MKLYLAVKNQVWLPNQVAQPLVSLNDFFAAKSFSELLYSYIAVFVTVCAVDAVKKVLEVDVDLVFVLVELLPDEFLVVEEYLGEEQVAQKENTDQQEGPEVQHRHAVLLEVGCLHIRVVWHCEQDEYRESRVHDRTEISGQLIVGKQNEPNDDENDEVGQDNGENGNWSRDDLYELEPDFANGSHEEKDEHDIEDVDEWRRGTMLVNQDPDKVDWATEHEGTHENWTDYRAFGPLLYKQAHHNEGGEEDVGN